MITRDQIAAALATIPELAPDSTTPPTIVAGSCWPVWASTRWKNAQGQREIRWYVFVALTGGDQLATVLEGDPLAETVAAALWAIGLWPEQIEPWAWAVEPGAQSIPVLRFTAVD